MLTAFVLLYAEPSHISALGAALAAIEGVTEVYSVTGDEDLLVVIRVADHTEIARIVTEEIAALDGINGSRTLIAFRQYDPADIGF
jgi:DNA-binding Lrp family transcriptional regulator